MSTARFMVRYYLQDTPLAEPTDGLPGAQHQGFEHDNTITLSTLDRRESYERAYDVFCLKKMFFFTSVFKFQASFRVFETDVLVEIYRGLLLQIIYFYTFPRDSFPRSGLLPAEQTTPHDHLRLRFYRQRKHQKSL